MIISFISLCFVSIFDEHFIWPMFRSENVCYHLKQKECIRVYKKEASVEFHYCHCNIWRVFLPIIVNCKWWNISFLLFSEATDTSVNSQQSNQRTNTINLKTAYKKHIHWLKYANRSIAFCLNATLSCHKIDVHVCYKIINEQKYYLHFLLFWRFFIVFYGLLSLKLLIFPFIMRRVENCKKSLGFRP